jgi:very-short-patch-repair endonuclease
MKTKLYNITLTKETRKYLRRNLTPAEAVLWRSIKNKQLDGKRFRRQYGVGKYVLDFYCPSEKLCVELDGAHHFTPSGILRDEKRDGYLHENDIKVIRIENQHVFDRHEHVLEYIKSYFKKS